MWAKRSTAKTTPLLGRVGHALTGPIGRIFEICRLVLAPLEPPLMYVGREQVSRLG